jgi:hypothetical protein
MIICAMLVAASVISLSILAVPSIVLCLRVAGRESLQFPHAKLEDLVADAGEELTNSPPARGEEFVLVGVFGAQEMTYDVAHIFCLFEMML